MVELDRIMKTIPIIRYDISLTETRYAYEYKVDRYPTVEST
jgi:hypothetical protein